MAMRLTAPADGHLTLTALEQHYGSFVQVLNNIRMCERGMEEREAIDVYLDTLPTFILQYLGSSTDAMATLADVHREATKAIRIVDAYATTRSAFISSITEHNEQTVNEQINNEQEEQKEQEEQEKQEQQADDEQPDTAASQDIMRCLHCGGAHIIIDCATYKNGQPQTPSGMYAWANWQEQLGTAEVYDAVSIYNRVRKKREELPGQRASTLPYKRGKGEKDEETEEEDESDAGTESETDSDEEKSAPLTATYRGTSPAPARKQQ
jgi:hypothetical protein